MGACRAAELFEDPEWAALVAGYEPECANPLLGATKPQRAMYEQFEDMGFGQCFAARWEGQLVGFAFLLMAVLPHYGRAHATVESLFVAQSARSGGIGTRLMEAAEVYAWQRGCAAILYSAPAGSRLARLLQAQGVELTNYVFTKRLP